MYEPSDKHLVTLAGDLFDEGVLMEAIRQVAATEPERVYQTDDVHSFCIYLPGPLNPCGCIVGEAMVLLGVPVGVLRRADELGPLEGGSAWGAPQMRKLLKDYFTDRALGSAWVAAVQEFQDKGLSWGAAIEQADATFEVRL